MEIGIRPYETATALLTPEKIRGLSVREISNQFGSEGLDYAIDHRLETLELHENNEINFSRELAYELHQEDTRSDGSTGTDHLRRTTLRLMQGMGITSPPSIAAQFLHDSVEDHAEKIISMLSVQNKERTGNLHADALRALMPYLSTETIKIIATLTYPKFPKGPARLAAYARQTRITLQCPSSQPGKLSDFIDNGVENNYTQKPSLQLRLDAKQLGCYGAHFEALNSPSCVIPHEYRPALRQQLLDGYEAAMQRLRDGCHQELLDADIWDAAVALTPELTAVR